MGTTGLLGGSANTLPVKRWVQVSRLLCSTPACGHHLELSAQTGAGSWAVPQCHRAGATPGHCLRPSHPARRDRPAGTAPGASSRPHPRQKVSWKFRLAKYNPFSKPQLLTAVQHFTTFDTWTTHESFSKEMKSRFAFFLPQTVARPIKEIQRTVKMNTSQSYDLDLRPSHVSLSKEIAMLFKPMWFSMLKKTQRSSNSSKAAHSSHLRLVCKTLTAAD